jgi:hypothetical protein
VYPPCTPGVGLTRPTTNRLGSLTRPHVRDGRRRTARTSLRIRRSAHPVAPRVTPTSTGDRPDAQSHTFAACDRRSARARGAPDQAATRRHPRSSGVTRASADEDRHSSRPADMSPGGTLKVASRVRPAAGPRGRRSPPFPMRQRPKGPSVWYRRWSLGQDSGHRGRATNMPDRGASGARSRPSPAPGWLPPRPSPEQISPATPRPDLQGRCRGFDSLRAHQATCSFVRLCVVGPPTQNQRSRRVSAGQFRAVRPSQGVECGYRPSGIGRPCRGRPAWRW